jgi:antitoxin component YwqK of YwqJK toxin-antitoxin module
MNYELKIILLFACVGVLQIATADTIFNNTDALGRRQGFWRKHHPNGKIAYNAFFVNNYVRGDLVRYHENGKKMAVIHYYDGNEPALAKLYSTEGALAAQGKYIANGVKFETWKYYNNGKLAMQENYDSIGKRNGEQLIFYPSGKVFERYRFVHGLQEGLYQQMNENGQPIVEMMYRNGKINGKARYYYNNNQIRMDGQYEDGIRTGEWTFYDSHGRLERRAAYIDGVASDQDKIDAYQSEYLKQMEQNRGRYEEPEDMAKRW